MPTNLTIIKFSVYKRSKCDIRFLKYTLWNAEALKTVTITWANSRVEEESELCTELLKLSRASRYCEISEMNDVICTLQSRNSLLLM
ncbi:hypothetical protein Hanom_Chr16g01422131 [Helianthus anomalus]